MSDAQPWIDALQSSHDQFVRLVQPLGEAEVKQPAYPEEWSIADTASHLGSQAEIMGLFLTAGLTGGPGPEQADYQAIWDRWNALPPTEQASGSIAATQTFLTRIQQVSPGERESSRCCCSAREADLGDLAAARLASTPSTPGTSRSPSTRPPWSTRTRSRCWSTGCPGPSGTPLRRSRVPSR